MAWDSFKKILSIVIILFCCLVSLQTTGAAHSLRYGKLLFTLGTKTSSAKKILELLKIDEEKLLKTLENVCVQPLVVYFSSETKSGGSVSEVPFNKLEFMLQYAKAELIDSDKAEPVTIPGKGSVFLVSIPYVVKGSSYQVDHGQVVIRTDEKAYQELIQPAEIRIVVDQSGKVYW